MLNVSAFKMCIRDRGYPWISRNRNARSLLISAENHAAEFIERKRVTILADALRPLKDRAGRIQLDPKREQEQQRA